MSNSSEEIISFINCLILVKKIISIINKTILIFITYFQKYRIGFRLVFIIVKTRISFGLVFIIVKTKK